jgi:hypothetical protein
MGAEDRAARAQSTEKKENLRDFNARLHPYPYLGSGKGEVGQRRGEGVGGEGRR